MHCLHPAIGWQPERRWQGTAMSQGAAELSSQHPPMGMGVSVTDPAVQGVTFISNISAMRQCSVEAGRAPSFAI